MLDQEYLLEEIQDLGVFPLNGGGIAIFLSRDARGPRRLDIHVRNRYNFSKIYNSIIFLDPHALDHVQNTFRPFL